MYEPCLNRGSVTLSLTHSVTMHGVWSQLPIATFQSGPVNSLRGAAFLTRLSDAVVVDIGGTTTDVGVLQAGFPRPAPTHVSIAGLRTNFQMPDMLSVGVICSNLHILWFRV